MPNDPKFISITDFRPGIIEPSNNIYPFMLTNKVVTGNVTRGQRSSQGLSQPNVPGSADYANTWGCAVTQDGGLVAMPGFLCIGLPFCSNLTNGATNTLVTVSGIKALGPILSSAPTTLTEPQVIYLALTFMNTLIRFSLSSVGPGMVTVNPSTIQSNLATWTLNIATASGSATSTAMYGVSMDATRFQNAATFYPVLCFEVSDNYNASPPVASMLCAFTPSLAGAFNTNTAFTAAGAGPIFTHQNRCVQLRYNYIGAYNYFTNENIFYTDPALTSTTFNATASIFVAEAPSNINVWGSISTGELLCIKQWGGGFIMTGDFNNPSITRLPGIRSPGTTSMKGVLCSIGLVYVTEADGVWVWNGSNTSEKISYQLDNSRFLPFHPNIGGCTLHCDTWNHWVFFPNSIVYDFQASSWWRFCNPNFIELDKWARSAGSDFYFWGVVSEYNTTDALNDQPPFLAQVDSHTYQPNFQWRSNALPPSVDRAISLTEYELGMAMPLAMTFSNLNQSSPWNVVPPNPTYTINVSSYSWDGASDSFDSKIVTPTSQYQKVRGQLGTQGYGISAQVEIAMRSSSNILTAAQSVPGPTANGNGDEWNGAAGGGVNSANPTYVSTASISTTPPPYNTGRAMVMKSNAAGTMTYITQTGTFTNKPVMLNDYYGFSCYVFSPTNVRAASITIIFYNGEGTATSTQVGTSVNTIVGQWVRVPFVIAGNELIQNLALGNFAEVTVTIAATGGANEIHYLTAAFFVCGSAMYGWSALNNGNVPLTTGVPSGEWYGGGFSATGGYSLGGGKVGVGGWGPFTAVGEGGPTPTYTNLTVSPIIKEFHLGYHEAAKVM